VQQELEEAGKENSFIKIYLNNIEKTESGWAAYQRPVINYKTVLERINNSTRRVPLNPLEAKRLAKNDIRKIADDFLKETRRIKLEKYMRVFDRVKYPYKYRPILEITKGRNKRADRLVEYAAGALKYFSGDEIRNFAIECLSNTKTPAYYLDLLVSNYKKGDSKLLTEIAKNCKTEEAVHSIVYGDINIYKANRTKECKEPLKTIYEMLTCGLHRKEIVKILIENNVLSKKIKQEIKFDSFIETRQLLS
jgi:hypothetical protein